MFEVFRKIQAATLEARARTGNNTIGTRCEKGRFQIVSVTYGNAGKSTVLQRSDWMPADQIVCALGEVAA